MDGANGKRGDLRPGERLRAVVFGTPEFAVPLLARVAVDPRFEVVLVVTQPDRPAGRGRRLEAPPVKRAASDLGLPVYQPETLRSDAARQPLVAASADLFLVAAFGLIFGPRTLAIPRLGCVNLHASLLPAYRGASPVAAAIAAGETVTGVSLMLMDRGLDTGAVIATVEETITAEDTTASLAARLAARGAALAVERLPDFAAGGREPQPQPPTGATLTRPLTKADGWLDWSRPVAELERRVRAMWPWPRAWTLLDREPLQVHTAAVAAPPPDHPADPPGTLIEIDGLPAVVTGDGALLLRQVQPAGGKVMDGRAFLAGRRYALTQVLGVGERPPAQPPLVVPVAPETG